ncbi:hypothetical protein F4678DRAFT_321760 [Xylaria arbuscula]|nr:hypothetical protein F4678DRAFT_321760 [Xylaria arbuscula]
MPETLREKASKKIQGPDANPSQLGDPISIKAENSETVPTDDEAGASSSPSSSSKSLPSSKSLSSNNSGGGETLREKAAKKLNGPDANPSQLGDPISLKNETSPGIPVESERGADCQEKVVKRDSKL